MEKTYVFDTNAGGLNSEALIASLMNNKGVDPNLMALLSKAGNNQDAWGGGGMWWIWVIIMFWLWGGNGNMFGRNGGLDGIPNQLNNDFGRDILLQAINGNGTAISQLAGTLNCDVNSLRTAIGQVQSSIQGVGSQVGMTGQQIINAIQAGNCQIGNQLAQCCCNIQDSITRQGYENQIATTNQTTALIGAGATNTNAIIAKLDAMQTQSLYDKIDALREKNSTLVSQLSQEHQTAAIQAYQAQSLIPVNAALQDLSNRLGAIECKQPATVTVPYIPAMSNLVPVSYSQPVNFSASAVGYSSCGC
jgi:hypothetical protein